MAALASPLSASNPDCWYHVADAKKRKQIQDRLAQRARRKRLAAQSINTAKPASSVSAQVTIQQRGLPTLTFPDNFLPIPNPLADTPLYTTAFTVAIPPCNPDAHFPVEIPPSVFSALFRNGELLGLTCGTVIPARSQPPPLHLPSSLHPTELQLTVIHQTWIDRFPFPRFRDNVIRLGGVICEEDFMRDMFSMDSFRVERTREPWDAAGWRIGREFGGKWGWLFV